VDGAERLTITSGEGAGSELTVVGELDAYTAPALEGRLLGSIAQDDLRIDLSGVSFMDSTGIRVIVKVDNELRSRDRALVIVRPSPAVLRLLQLTSLDDRLRIEAAS
jgi:anti-sigma B factor antagonist